ncbi:MAG: hypothetical protein HQ582_13000 [Planctomycetes bacterium]|nr:hypothetical protein [Planctomycetota bacterium]
MRRQRSVLIQVSYLFVVSALCETAAAAPSPVALLRGVEAARGEHDSVRVTLEIRYILPEPAKTVECLVEMDGARRRFEVFEGEVPNQVIIRDDDEFHAYRRVEHEDVHVYDLREARGRGVVAFDPRVLGFNDNMSCSLTLKECLWYEDNESLHVTGQESLRGSSVWRVKAVRKKSEGEYWSEYWIEEPSFRVHRRTVETQFHRIEIDSEFDADDSRSPFPSRVKATRTFLQDERKCEREYLVERFDVSANIPSERFTLESMDLPVNTPVLDDRISYRIGFWNGEGLSENPVDAASVKPFEAPRESGRRWVLMVSGILLLLLVSVLIAWRYRHARA